MQLLEAIGVPIEIQWEIHALYGSVQGNVHCTHIGGWIHHQALLYGHKSILCVVQCDREIAKFCPSVRD